MKLLVTKMGKAAGGVGLGMGGDEELVPRLAS